MNNKGVRFLDRTPLFLCLMLYKRLFISVWHRSKLRLQPYESQTSQLRLV